MLPPALEMSGFRRLRRNFAPIITATLRIMEVVIIERKAFEALMADVSSLTEKELVSGAAREGGMAASINGRSFPTKQWHAKKLGARTEKLYRSLRSLGRRLQCR